MAAEDAWLGLHASAGLPVHVFRLAGIYGPGRGPFEKVRQGAARRVIKEGQVFSRIHVAPPEDVIAHAAELLGLPIPPAVPFEEAEMTPMARSFYSESKRTSNARIREELGVELAFPSYREGLAALLADTRDPA